MNFNEIADNPAVLANVLGAGAARIENLQKAISEKNGEGPGAAEVLATVLDTQKLILMALISNFRMRAKYETQRVIVPPLVGRQ